MTRLVGGVLGVLALALLLYLGLSGGCPARDPSGVRADSVLTDTTWKATVRAQDSAITRLEDSLRVSDRERVRWKRLALVSIRAVDSLQAEVDATVAAGVPDTVPPAVFWKDRWEEQRRVTARLRDETVPALLATIAADSVGIGQRDAALQEMRGQRDSARARANEVTAEFRRYRADTRPGIDLGLFRVPAWVGYAAVAVGSAAVTVAVVK